MIKYLILFLLRIKLGVKKGQEFRFINQRAQCHTYRFTDEGLIKKYYNHNGIDEFSSVSLNWLLNDDCGIEVVEDWEFKYLKKGEKQMKVNETVLVGIDISSDDTAVLIVGRKNPKEGVKIINAFQGEEAIELYKKLTVRKENN